MSYFLIFILFIWLLILQDQVTTLKTKLQKLLNDSWRVHSSQAKDDNTSAAAHVETQSKEEVWQNETDGKDEYKFVNSTTNNVRPAIKEAVSFKKTSEETEKTIVEKTGFEKIFLGNIFNKIGALAIITGIAFFIKVVSQYIVFTPALKITLAFLAGALMVTGALKLHEDKMKNYAEVLMGTGFAVLFITLYCAAGLYHLLPVAAATAFGVLLVMLTYYIADRFNTFSTFLIGFAGGYLNPFFINSNISMNFLFGYLIFLNLVSAVYVYKNESKKPLNFINLILTTLTVSVFAAVKGDEINYLFPVGLWALYVVNDFIEIIKNRYNDYYKGNTGFNVLNFLCFVYLMKCFNSEEFVNAGLFAIGAALIYGVFLYIIKNKDNGHIKYFTDGILLSVLTATYFTLNGTIRVDAWAIEGLIIAFIASKHKYIANQSAAFFAAAFTGTLFVSNAVFYSDISLYHPVFNFRLALFGVPALCAFISSYLLDENKKLSDILKFFSLSLVYMFILFESNSLCEKYLKTANIDVLTVKTLIYSIIGFTYAINTKRLGESLRSALFNYAGGAIFIISTLLLAASSFSYENTGMIPVLNLRFTAYLFAIAASVYYLKRTKFSFYGYLAVIFGFFCTHFEVSHFTSQNALGISVSWILYAAIITLCGIFMNKRTLTKSGIWIFILALLKVLLFDISYMETLYKFIIFLTLGVILMIVSYFYTKLKSDSN